MNANIWEFSLYFPRELLCYFESLKKQLKHDFANEKNCIDILIKDDFYVFMLAIEREVYNKNILKIKYQIAEIILLYYKPKIIIGTINNFDLLNSQNKVLIDILVSFEADLDKATIVENLSLINKLFLESFVSFKLGGLTKKWEDSANLINENSLFLQDDGIKKELLQFLMQGLTTNIEYLKLTNLGLNDGKNAIDSKKVFYSQSDFDNVLFTLINLYPQKIEIEDYKQYKIEFLELISNLFGERLNLIN